MVQYQHIQRHQLVKNKVQVYLLLVLASSKHIENFMPLFKFKLICLAVSLLSKGSTGLKQMSIRFRLQFFRNRVLSTYPQCDLFDRVLDQKTLTYTGRHSYIQCWFLYNAIHPSTTFVGSKVVFKTAVTKNVGTICCLCTQVY